MLPTPSHKNKETKLPHELKPLVGPDQTDMVVKNKKGFEILFMSFVISTLVSVVLAGVMIYFKLSIDVMLPVLAPVWVGATTLIFTAWKES